MISKQSAEVLLKIIAQSSVCPMAPDADANYRALAQARDELTLVKMGEEEPEKEAEE
jgi:hypothetical protein